MGPASGLFVSVFIKFFFLLTPFFVLTMFLSLTQGMDRAQQRRTAGRVTVAVVVTCLTLFFFGQYIFAVFGITLDAFRIGAGSLLFLAATGLISGRDVKSEAQPGGGVSDDISVVPLAVPITVGPATIGALLVLSAEYSRFWDRIVGVGALVSAILCVGGLLMMAPTVERIIGRRGLAIMSKITGLVLAALAAQIIFTGIRNFLGLGPAGH